MHFTEVRKNGKISAGVNMRFTPALHKIVAGIAVLLCASCGESEEAKKVRAAQFTTAPRPAPNPQREALESLVRTDLAMPTFHSGVPRFELYSEYAGADMRQVTGVSGRTLLLCFTAPWCRHSEAMRHSLQELAKAEKGRVQVVEINADAYPAIAEDYGLSKVPTTVFYTEGIRLRTIEGAYTAESLRRYLHALLTQEEEQPE